MSSHRCLERVQLNARFDAPERQPGADNNHNLLTKIICLSSANRSPIRRKNDRSEWGQESWEDNETSFKWNKITIYEKFRQNSMVADELAFTVSERYWCGCPSDTRATHMNTGRESAQYCESHCWAPKNAPLITSAWRKIIRKWLKNLKKKSKIIKWNLITDR